MRIRTVKPEFWTHEGLCNQSDFTRLLAIALLNWADDEGYFLANPILIRGQVFPFQEDSKKIPGSLQDLSKLGWIQLGKDEQGRAVGRVVNFLKHQRIDKPQASKIKPSSVFQERSKNDPGTIQDDSKEEGKGMEEDQGKGKEGEPPKPPRGAEPIFPADFPESHKPILSLWWKHKKEKGKGYKPTGWATLCNVHRLTPIDHLTDSVQASIASNYDGIHEPKGSGGRYQPKNHYDIPARPQIDDGLFLEIEQEVIDNF